MRRKSVCGVEIFRRVLNRPGQQPVYGLVVMVSELADNPGTAVTNAWPELADEIARAFSLSQYVEALTDIVWIEHYPPRRYCREETFDRVLFEIEEGRYILSRYAQHPWVACSAEQVACFLASARPLEG